MSKNKKMCCVMGCPSVQAHPREALYLYPPNTTQRYKRWLKLFPNSFVLHSDKDNYICRRHFTVESFDSKLRLKHSADPTINIDTSYAQDQILRTFHTKVIYEWSLRADVADEDLLVRKALEAKDLLGLSSFKADRCWILKFLRIRNTNMQNGVRFGKKEPGNIEIFDIIKNLRSYLPSNFTLPIDLMNVTSEGEALEVKNECYSDGDDVIHLESSQQSDGIENPEPSEIAQTTIEVVQQQALNTYQEALDLLKPLEAYINQTGNEKALVRLREVETVVRQVVDSERKPRRAVKRNWSTLLSD